MKITQEQKNDLEKLYQSLLHNEKIMRMKDIPMHRGSNCYEHCFTVAKKAIKLCESPLKKNIDLETVILGAILHDYYLYDWRVDSSKRKGHGRKHQYIAAENASRDFEISMEVRKVIESHMWPLNFHEYPKSKEAKIVSIVDKMVTLRQALTTHKHKEKRREHYLAYISHLF